MCMLTLRFDNKFPFVLFKFNAFVAMLLINNTVVVGSSIFVYA